jgi:hypothetical protein
MKKIKLSEIEKNYHNYKNPKVGDIIKYEEISYEIGPTSKPKEIHLIPINEIIDQGYYLFENMTIWYNENGYSYIFYIRNDNIYYESYMLNNGFHNEHGPARIWYDKNGQKQKREYWLNDKQISVL